MRPTGARTGPHPDEPPQVEVAEDPEAMEPVGGVVPNTPAEDAAIARHLAEALAEASPDAVDLTLRRYHDWQQRRRASGGGRG